MDALAAYVPQVLGGGLLMPAALVMLLAGACAVLWPVLAGGDARSDVKRRLRVEPKDAPDDAVAARPLRQRHAVQEIAARSAQDFYAKTDPENVARLRMRLIQAGYMEPGAVGRFFLARFAGLVAGAVLALLVAFTLGGDAPAANRWVLVGGFAVMCYFLPGLLLSRVIKRRVLEYRNGFPDFMDLMIVCADAGMSMEAGIERVSRELMKTYPALAQNLQLVSIELRAGRTLDDALKSLADRLSLDEVRSFATLLQQSKELGTSLSGALRVFSDEMRHKRMSVAEEKAHALPAKMSVPVTVCILPVVVMIAIIPIIVKLTGD